SHFFFSSRRRHTRWPRDWSSDVCSSDLASRGVAVSCTVAPCGTLADAGVTVTDATGTFDTVTTAVPLCPSLVAVIVAAPVATAEIGRASCRDGVDASVLGFISAQHDGWF